MTTDSTDPTVNIDFFTEESAQSWLDQNEGHITILRQDSSPPKGDGSPCVFVKVSVKRGLYDAIIGTIYPSGMISEKSE